MSRIKLLWNKISETVERCGELPPVYTHIIQVSELCALIALKRRENVELATMAGALHDIASLRNHDIEPYKTYGLTSQNHAEVGADIGMEILLELNMTTQEENNIICEAIRKHSNKEAIDTAFDEVIKDADVFAHGLSDVTANNFRGKRWDSLCDEFNMYNPNTIRY